MNILQINLEKLKKFKLIIGVITTVLVTIASGVVWAYGNYHVIDIDEVKALIVASDTRSANARELNALRSERRDLNRRIESLEGRQTNIWSRRILTPQEDRILKIINRTLTDLKADQREINKRIRELEK